jgi:outer membrane biosynthesis protein TonB
MVRSYGTQRWSVGALSSLGAHAALVAAALAGGMSHAEGPQSAGYFAPGMVETTVVVELVTPTDSTEPAPAPAPPADVAVTTSVRRARIAPRARRAEVPVVTEAATLPRPLEPALHGDPDEDAPDAGDAVDSRSLARAAGAGGGGTSVSAQPPAIQQSAPIASLKWGYRRIYQSFPRLPHSLSGQNKEFSVELQLCVAADGQVSHVGLRRGAARELDEAVVATARTWRYRPYLVDGVPRPFCHLMKIDYEVQ